MALTEQERREKRLKNSILFLAVGYLLYVFVLLHACAVHNSYDDFALESIAQVEEFADKVTLQMQTKPFFMFALGEEAEGQFFRLLRQMFLFSVFYLVVALVYLTTRKKYMLGKEHGTAQWASKSEGKKLLDRNRANNIIFTQTEGMSLNTRKTGKNLNMLIIGSPGTGKTRYFAKPNILQANTSFVITDPKGELLRDTGCFLQKRGYRIKVFNIIDMEHSDGYNPFNYMRTEIDAIKLIECFVQNTTPENAQSNDPFWEKAEIALLQALVFFVWYELPKEEQNFATILELLRKAEVREADDEYESDLDLIFRQLEREKPGHIALKQYAIFKQAAGKTAKSILISAGVRLAIFNIPTVANLTSWDTLELDAVGDQKTAVFVLMSDSNTAFNFLVAMMYTQFFDVLYYAADFKYRGRLPVHVRFILDEFANIGQIPNFDKFAGTMRSREVSVSIIIQNISQLKAIYENSWENIIGNCDSLLFLGGKDFATLEYISKELGEETIDTYSTNITKETQLKFTTTKNYDILARELMKPDELGRMPDRDCILHVRGFNPFYSQKYDLEGHKNYRYLYDSSDQYYFDYRSVRGVGKSRKEKGTGEKPYQHEDSLLKERALDRERLKFPELKFRLTKKVKRSG